jgi:xylan 1,4-beta-xylosidase
MVMMATRSFGGKIGRFIFKSAKMCFWMYLTLQSCVAFSQTKTAKLKTFCNPINLPYNFQRDGVARREAADPTVVLYQDRYWLFASKQQGYWYSDDMLQWTFVKPEGLPLEVYAPSVTLVNGKMCFFSGNNNGAFTTDDPAAGKWRHINNYTPGCTDPALFQDSDGKVYLYNGCSDTASLQVTQMDATTFLPVGNPVKLINSLTAQHGWEVPGNHNRGNVSSNLLARPWIEGSYMNKIGNKYYLQYAAPGTQYKTYGDGVYVSDKPTGPFVYASYNPFSFKPTGFIAGAGHSSTFQAKTGEYWHMATGTISVRHMFERRLVLFPIFITHDGQMVTDTYLGDYPQYAAGGRKHSSLAKSPGWMLLSFHKKADASSTLGASKTQNFAINNAFDEDIQTWWSAATGNAGEWLRVDLGKTCRVNAIQVNFADQDAKVEALKPNDGYQYSIEYSVDGKKWLTAVDRKNVMKDTPHDYIELPKPVQARFIRITNVHSPANSKFSLFDFRVFGKSPEQMPKPVSQFKVTRNAADRRCAHIEWKAVAHADFYIVRYGISPNKLFSSYQVYKGTQLNINALNTTTNYYLTIDAINAAGIALGKTVSSKF